MLQQVSFAILFCTVKLTKYLILDYENLGQLLNGILFEPGHPEVTLQAAIDEGSRAAQALVVRGLLSNV